MGTRVAVLKNGHLQQVDTPQALYDHPANSFVAAFIGSPSMNLYQAELDAEDGSVVVRFGSQSLPVPAELLAANPELQAAVGKPVVLGIRPEAFERSPSAKDQRPTVDVIVELVEALGAELVVHTAIEAPAAEIDDPDRAEAVPIVDQRGSLCIARLPPKTELTIGATIRLAVDTSDIQIFDAVSGRTLRSDR